MSFVVGKPDLSECSAFYHNYLRLVDEEDVLQALESQVPAFSDLMARIAEGEAEVAHEPYQWTIRQVIGHVIDTERVMAYRAMRFAVGDEARLPGFDQDAYATQFQPMLPTLFRLSEEWLLLRQANLCMMQRFSPEMWSRGGVADNAWITVRALAYVMVGHVRHHLQIIERRLSVA